MPFDVSGELRMPDTGEYRAQAATCVQLAQKSDDPEIKLGLLDMARAWLALATQGDKNRQTTLVYETPEPLQEVAQQQQQPQPKKG
jgi:hypothetical protein